MTGLKTPLTGGSVLILTLHRPSNLSLNVDCSDSSRLLLHLLHPLGGQIEVGLQVVAGQQQPQHTQGHDDPQAQAVKRGAGNSARGSEKWSCSITVDGSELDTGGKTCACAHSVIDVFPIGALARKSLAMGFTQRTNTMTGERKPMCSRALQVMRKICAVCVVLKGRYT